MIHPKRILVVTSDVPFVKGGHIIIAQCTVQALKDYGYEADLVITPQNRFGRQLRAYTANFFTDVEVDGLGRNTHQVISFRFPSFAVRHPRHVCWLNHRLREYYDLWDHLYSQLGWKGRIKESLRRQLIRAIDNYCLKHNVDKVFAQSRTIQKRLKIWGNIPSEVLYPPPPQKNYYTNKYGDYFFAVSRLHSLKRLDLLIKSFKHLKNKEIKAVIAGSGPEYDNLKNIIQENNLEKRVTLIGNADEKTVVRHLADCRAVYFAPLKEDYGLVTGEAFASSKCVITADDSGGPVELVKHGYSGYVCESKPEKIAEKLDILAEDNNLAEQMGQNAKKFISGITWDKTIERLIL